MIATVVPQEGLLESIHFSLTNACDRGCQMCHGAVRQTGDRTGRMHLRWDTLANILQWSNSMGVKVLALGGGEPAYYNYFDSLISDPNVAGMHLSVTTTRAQRILDHFYAIGRMDRLPEVDIHLSWDENHSKGGFTRSQLVESMALLRGYGVQRVGINHVVTKTDYLRQLTELEGIDQVVLLSLKPESWKVNERTLDYMAKKYEEVKKAPSLLVDACSGKDCGQGKWSLHVNWDGTVGACSHQTEGRLMMDKSTSLPEIWELVKRRVKDGDFGYAGRFCPAREALKETAETLPEM